MAHHTMVVSQVLLCLYCCCSLASAWIPSTDGLLSNAATANPRAARSFAALSMNKVSSTRSSTSTDGTGGAAARSIGLLAVAKTARRVRDSVLSRERSRDELKLGIAGFYDRSSKLWEDVWGEHMHHGYYVPENRTDHVQAQIDLIDKVLEWSNVSTTTSTTANIQSVLDVGCGIGGSSRHICKRFNCSVAVEGITLSPYQAQRATELAQQEGGPLASQVHFSVADALQMPFEDDSFDLIWSLESGEHMPDKAQFVREMMRVCRPGGRIVLVTWCHRDLDKEDNGSGANGERTTAMLSKREDKLLRKINRAYYLPQWCSVEDYVQLLTGEGATNIGRDDWSPIIAPFWKAVIRSSMNWRSAVGLLKSGFSTMRGAYAMWLMLRGFDIGLIKFGLITCTKPVTTTSTSTTETTSLGTQTTKSQDETEREEGQEGRE